MSWQDRLQEAAYTGPGSPRLTFIYENVAKTFSKRTSAYQFPDADGTFVQDLGSSGRQFPLRVFFSGENYDLEADAFDTSLASPGVGLLEHPKYGSVQVVPFGAIKRRDDLKTAANQAVIEVVFWESTAAIFPESQDDAASDVLSEVDGYNEAMANEFKDSIDVGLDINIPAIELGAAKAASFRERYQQTLTFVENKLKPIAAVQANVRRRFTDIVDSINRGINVLIADPLSLAFQTIELIQLPGRAAASIRDRLDAYGDLASQIISGSPSVSPVPVTANDFFADDLFVSTAVTGAIVSAVNNSFSTKTEAIAAAIEILDFHAAVTVWRDDTAAALTAAVLTEVERNRLIDTGEAFQKLQAAVALTAGLLVQISFTLRQERGVVLDRARTIVDLTAELYGVVDSELDFFIRSNDLTGSEILELPAGREVVYYT